MSGVSGRLSVVSVHTAGTHVELSSHKCAATQAEPSCCNHSSPKELTDWRVNAWQKPDKEVAGCLV